MIRNLYRIGKVVQGMEKYKEYFHPWQNPFPTTDPDQAKVVYFNVNNGVLDEQYRIEPFKKNLLKQYLYRELKGPNGTNLVPTYSFYPSGKLDEHKKNLDKLIGRIRRTFNENDEHLFKTKDDIEQALISLKEALVTFEPEKNVRYLLTFKSNGRWLGDIDTYIQLFNEDAYLKYYEKSKAKNKVCSVTYKESDIVWGSIDTLGFTVNDKTFSRGGFNPTDSYKMFPASPDAVFTLEGFSRFALSELTKRFCNLQYLILPRFVSVPDTLVEQLIGIISDQQREKTLEDQSRSLFKYEDLILCMLEVNSISKYSVMFDFFFYEKIQAQLSIKMHLTDVAPSQLSHVYSTKKYVEKKYEPLWNSERKGMFITFFDIKDFFSSNSGKNVVLKPYFFKILQSVFYGQALNELEAVKAFVAKIQSAFKQGGEDYDTKSTFETLTKQAFTFWHFFYNLGLFPDKNIIMMTTTNQGVTMELDAFVEEHKAFFNHPTKALAFYMGCLTEMLLNTQRRRLNSEPFRKELNGLNLDEAQLQKIFPRLLEKINQYQDEFYADQLRHMDELKLRIVPLLVEPAYLNRYETSFAFSAGLVMQKGFTKKIIEERTAAKAERESENA